MKTLMPSTDWNFRWMLLIALAACPQTAISRSPKASLDEGETLFAKSFSPGHARPGGGDGLGPLFNHVSCVACHRQGAVGGGGDIEFNVVLITARFEPGHRPDERLVLRSLRSLHPGFITGDDNVAPTILLHRFGPGEGYYEKKLSLGGLHVPIQPNDSERAQLQKQLARDPVPSLSSMNHIRLVRSQRNTTALFGAGLLDKIPDSALYDLAERQAAEGRVSGRVPPVGPDKVGRFGWRGQKEHLHDFVLDACANELGLEVPGHPQPINPLKPKYRPGGLDLSAAQCRALTAYVASLPPPRKLPPRFPTLRADRERGREVFASIGCSACHVEQVDSVQGIYSDLLLHDMGLGLADPVPAEPTLTFVRHIPREEAQQRPVQPSFMPSRGYSGGSSFQNLAVRGPQLGTVEIKNRERGGVDVFRAEASNLHSEWRTPPLWGVGDSAPYLHDGRAATLVDAITLHGGEADFAVKQFQSLDLADRMRLIGFLRSLRAPN